MEKDTYWGDFLTGGNFNKEFDGYLKEKVKKRVNDADFFLDILIEHNIIKLNKETIKEYFLKWFIENKKFDLQIENGDLAIEDGDLKFVPDFDKNDIVGFIKWFSEEKDEFLNYLKSNGVNVMPNEPKDSTTINAENVIINNDSKIESQSIVGSQKKKKWEKGFIISLISLTVTLIVLFFGNNLIGRFQEDSKTNNLENRNIESQIELLDTIKLPYLKNVPILDKAIFVKYNYNDLLIGGINIDSIKINARTKEGEKMTLNKSLSSTAIELNITEEPYIEFNYKGVAYSMDISGNHYSFNCIITKNIKSTMNLIPYNKI